MAINLNVLELRVLLSFLSYENNCCKVCEISRTLNEKTYTISRILSSLRDAGIVDKDEKNIPSLSKYGLSLAKYYERRIQVILSHMVSEGVDFSKAKEDALLSALFLSDDAINAICRFEDIYLLKKKISDKENIIAKDIVDNINDGSYSISFVFYKMDFKDGYLSMANSGFENPCSLLIRNSNAFIQLKVKSAKHRALNSLNLIKGKVRMMEYFHNGRFIHAEKMADVISIPLEAFKLKRMGSKDKQFIHGSLKLRFSVTVGLDIMPLSEALLTIQI